MATELSPSSFGHVRLNKPVSDIPAGQLNTLPAVAIRRVVHIPYTDINMIDTSPENISKALQHFPELEGASLESVLSSKVPAVPDTVFYKYKAVSEKLYILVATDYADLLYQSQELSKISRYSFDHVLIADRPSETMQVKVHDEMDETILYADGQTRFYVGIVKTVVAILAPWRHFHRHQTQPSRQKLSQLPLICLVYLVSH